MLHDPERANRLGHADTAWLLMDRALGVPMVNQMTWIFPEPFTTDRLQRLFDVLSAGPCSRLVATSRVPGARGRWIPAPATGSPHVESAAIAPDRLHDWLDRMASLPVNPVAGPPWRLASAPLDDGGTAVTLTVHHAVGDGSAAVQSLQALDGSAPLGRIPHDAASSHRLRHDLVDAVGQFRQAGVAAVNSVRSGRPAPPPKAAPLSDAGTGRPQAGGIAPTVFAQVAADDWQEAAARRGGTTNALLIAIAAGAVASTGRPLVDGIVPVGVPVATRVAGDLTGNSNSPAIVPVRVDQLYGDLSPVRASSRAAFAAVDPIAAGRQAQVIAPLTTLVPARAMRWATRFMPPAVCTTSNLGPAPDFLRSVGGSPADRLVIRTLAQGLDTTMARRSGGGVTAWAISTPQWVTIALQTLDFDTFPSFEAWRSHLAGELERWELAAHLW